MSQNPEYELAPAARKLSVVYAKMPTRKGPRKMHADIYLPHIERPPLLIWFHAGGFRRGSIDHPAHAEIGHAFAAKNFATAFIEYRLQTPPAALSKQGQALLPHLLADVEAHDFGLKPFLTGAGAIGAMENGIVFFKWLDKIGPRHGLTGPILLGGSSAGAMTALNLLSLPMHLGVRLPKVHAAFSMSGAFAYPSFYLPSATPILAQHNPKDHKVPFASIRAFARKAKPHCTLIKRNSLAHGALKFYPKEDLSVAVDRMVSFARGRGVPGDINP